MDPRIAKTDLQSIRLTAVRRVLGGESPEKVILEYGLARSCIYKWLKKYRERGLDARVSRRSSGRPPLLADSRRAELLKSLLKAPRTLGAWTIADLVHLIKIKFELEPSRVTVWRVLKSLGIVPVEVGAPGKAAWWRAHRSSIASSPYFVSELDIAVPAQDGGEAKDYVFLVASNARRKVLFQLYSEAPNREAFERFIYKLTPQRDFPITLVLSSHSRRYREALNLARELSLDKNATLPAEAKYDDQIIGEKRERLTNRKRYKQRLVVYRLD